MKFQIFLLTIVGFAALAAGQVQDKRKQCTACHEATAFVAKVAERFPLDEELNKDLIDLCVQYSHGLQRNETEDRCRTWLNTVFYNVRHRLDTSKVCEHTRACYSTRRWIESFATQTGTPQDCDFCVFAFGKIKDIFTGAPTDIEMKNILADGCQYLGQFKDECAKLVDDYVDTIISYMKDRFQPKEMCSSLRFCAARHLHRTPLFNMKPVRTEVLLNLEGKSNENMNCAICKRVVKIIQTQLQNNATDDDIVNVLNDFCVVLPKNDQPNCHQVVTQYARNLIQILSQDIDPDFACTIAGICNNQLLRNNIKQHSNAACVECQMITHYIQNELYNYKNEEQIDEFIKNHVCKSIGAFAGNCENFIQQYGPIIMQAIAQEVFDPKTVCYMEIPVCKKPKVVQEVASTKMCSMCMNMVDKLHLEQAKEVDIERFIEKSCDQLEPQHKAECGMMAKAFAPYIFDVIKHHHNSKDICQSLDICTVPGKVNLLGGHKCTFGPSYWCLSSSHADACSAGEYCSKKKSPQ